MHNNFKTEYNQHITTCCFWPSIQIKIVTNIFLIKKSPKKILFYTFHSRIILCFLAIPLRAIYYDLEIPLKVLSIFFIIYMDVLLRTFVSNILYLSKMLNAAEVILIYIFRPVIFFISVQSFIQSLKKPNNILLYRPLI